MTLLDRLRTWRTPGACFFVGVLFLVAAERRLAEIHFNLRVAETAFDNDDALDRDEIRIRLVALNDDQPPTLTRYSQPIELRVVAYRTGTRVTRALGRPAPRGPPALLAVA